MILIQLGLNVIDSLREVARYISGTLFEFSCASNCFALYGLSNELQPYKILDDELRVFGGMEKAYVSFTAVYPADIISIDAGDIVVINEKDTDVVLTSWENAGATPLNYKHKYTESHTQTESTNIAAEISTELSGKIGAKYGAFEAEMTSKISAKLGVTHNATHQEVQTDDKEMDIQVPAWTKTSLLQKHSESDVKQTVTTRCRIDARVSVVSQGYWVGHFDSIESIQLWLQGGGGSVYPDIDEKLATRKAQSLEIPQPIIEIVKDRRYRDVKTESVSRKDVSIEH